MQRSPADPRDAGPDGVRSMDRLMAIHHGTLRGVDYRARRPVSCFRCGTEERVVDDDGAPVCMVCILAWGSYAGMISVSEPEPDVAVHVEPHRDPTVTALLHWSHRVPVVDCPLCLARR